ncbi:hypothetical protein B1H29_32915 [Streptomyces pactum]|uniref:CHAT domain-containing protein n=1 Tax=Streptomyces pactum TaxID=68249 RepID=A0A1S6JH19_9ACTN|nr:hypothetical protein B1H29_32915 [Streptomyces pactum]
MFFNACRSAGEIDWFGESLERAPQSLNAGGGPFIGTLRPVRSRSALQFAEACYDQFIAHRQPLGQASLEAWQTIRDLHGGDPTWPAYAVSGSPLRPRAPPLGGSEHGKDPVFPKRPVFSTVAQIAVPPDNRVATERIFKIEASRGTATVEEEIRTWKRLRVRRSCAS